MTAALPQIKALFEPHISSYESGIYCTRPKLGKHKGLFYQTWKKCYAFLNSPAMIKGQTSEIGPWDFYKQDNVYY